MHHCCTTTRCSMFRGPENVANSWPITEATTEISPCNGQWIAAKNALDLLIATNTILIRMHASSRHDALPRAQRSLERGLFYRSRRLLSKHNIYSQCKCWTAPDAISTSAGYWFNVEGHALNHDASAARYPPVSWTMNALTIHWACYAMAIMICSSWRGCSSVQTQLCISREDDQVFTCRKCAYFGTMWKRRITENTSLRSGRLSVFANLPFFLAVTLWI